MTVVGGKGILNNTVNSILIIPLAVLDTQFVYLKRTQ